MEQALVSELLDWINKNGDMKSFPDIVPLRSLEQLNNGQTLIILEQDSKLRVYEDVKLQRGEVKGMIPIKFDKKFYEIRYSFREGKFVGEEKDLYVPERLISDRMITHFEVYVPNYAQV